MLISCISYFPSRSCSPSPSPFPASYASPHGAQRIERHKGRVHISQCRSTSSCEQQQQQQLSLLTARVISWFFDHTLTRLLISARYWVIRILCEHNLSNTQQLSLARSDHFTSNQHSPTHKSTPFFLFIQHHSFCLYNTNISTMTTTNRSNHIAIIRSAMEAPKQSERPLNS